MSEGKFCGLDQNFAACRKLWALLISMGSWWPHNALQYHCLSCHFWHWKSLLVTSL